ncbi:unnamed protein product [Paramecium octaurelia]|uniref:Uncharacterized protein n=1 Tax=Paramecium octaurelia TaxID=43137 RepID=A0A8S1WIX0_PAROT|nr:unnamed protein product [Paramecium octaurelia]
MDFSDFKMYRLYEIIINKVQTTLKISNILQFYWISARCFKMVIILNNPAVQLNTKQPIKLGQIQLSVLIHNNDFKIANLFSSLIIKFVIICKPCTNFYPTNSSLIPIRQSVTGMHTKIYKTPITTIIMLINKWLTHNLSHVINRSSNKILNKYIIRKTQFPLKAPEDRLQNIQM